MTTRRIVVVLGALGACSGETTHPGREDAPPGSGIDGPDGATSDDYAPSEGPQATGARVVAVATTGELLAAIAAAAPGDAITLEDGTYDVGVNIDVSRPGTAEAPIFVRARNPLQAHLRFCNTEGFVLSAAAWWIFEGLHVEGVCHADGDGVNEHAFHIAFRSSHVILRHNWIVNFKSHVKLNAGRESAASAYEWPDDDWFIANTWQDTVPLGGVVPHNVLNLDGGDRHVIRGNAFVDICTSIPAQVSTSSIYVKMTARDFLVEQNLVVCTRHLAFDSDRRGIYSGDAFGPSPYCDGDCANLRGIYRNNIVLGCQGQGNSTGIILGYEKDTVYLHNTVQDVKSNYMPDDTGTTVKLYANLLYLPFVYGGATRPVDMQDNLEQGLEGSRQIWTNADAGDFSLLDGSPIRGKAPRRAEAPHDFCGHARTDPTDLGAIDYGHPQAVECVGAIKAWYDRL